MVLSGHNARDSCKKRQHDEGAKENGIPSHSTHGSFLLVDADDRTELVVTRVGRRAWVESSFDSGVCLIPIARKRLFRASCIRARR